QCNEPPGIAFVRRNVSRFPIEKTIPNALPQHTKTNVAYAPLVLPPSTQNDLLHTYPSPLECHLQQPMPIFSVANLLKEEPILGVWAHVKENLLKGFNVIDRSGKFIGNLFDRVIGYYHGFDREGGFCALKPTAHRPIERGFSLERDAAVKLEELAYHFILFTGVRIQNAL